MTSVESVGSDDRLARVTRVWRSNGLKPSTIACYQKWLRIFRADVRHRGQSEQSLLTSSEVRSFASRYSRRRGIGRENVWCGARCALRAWSWGLAACGESVPDWAPASSPTASPSPLLADFARYRREVRGVAESTLSLETDDLIAFLKFLRSRRRGPLRVRLTDIDAYVIELRKRLALRTVARVCTSIRAFLRFLHATGRLPFDFASSVAAPTLRWRSELPRALPWRDVRIILSAIDRKCRVGRRDYALLLAMAVYGLGAGEVRSLSLDDVDWAGGTFRVRRPKTGREIVLPLLPAVARALLGYLRSGRPKHTASRALFVKMHCPYDALPSSSAIRHILIKHAHAAGIDGPFLGSHALRHSHATRQIDLGVLPKLVGDILGHLTPASTSIYARVALRRLRHVALPVPR